MKPLPAINEVLTKPNETADCPDLLWRVLWVAPPSDLIVLFRMCDPPLKPIAQSLSDIVTALQAGEMHRVEYTLPPHMLGHRPSKSKRETRKWAAATKRRDKNWAVIADLVSQANLPALYDDANRGALIRQAARASGKPPKTVYRLLYRYWRYGMTPDALLPHYAYSGAAGKTREPKAGARKRGRPRKVATLGHDSGDIGINISKDIREKLLLGYDLFYANRKKVSLKKAYDKTLNKFFPDIAVETADGIAQQAAHICAKPSLGQFQYVVHKHRDRLDEVRSREGQRRFNLNHRGLHGWADQGLFGPGHRFEIDATIGDVYLVSSYNVDWIIGRPVIYIVIDAFSRLIVGLHVGLSGPSWGEASLALYNAFTSNVSYCARYGVKIAPEMWPSEHLPAVILADRGELAGKAPAGLINGLHVEVDNTAPFRGDLKGIVERRFRTLNDKQIHFMPGAVRQRQKERGERDYRLDATLTLGEFNHIMINAILEHNLLTRREDLLSKPMMAANVRPYPVDIWQWGLQNLTGSLRRMDQNLIRVHLLPSATATVTASGITWRRLKYTSPRAMRENWFSRARNFGSWKLDIRYDDNDPREIYYLTDDGAGIEPCVLQDPKRRYEHARGEEIIDMLEYQRLCSATAQHDDRRRAEAFLAGSEAMIADAVERRRNTATKTSNARRLSGIREHRSQEAKLNQIRDGMIRKGKLATVHRLPTQTTPPREKELSPGDDALLETLTQARDEPWSEKNS